MKPSPAAGRANLQTLQAWSDAYLRACEASPLRSFLTALALMVFALWCRLAIAPVQAGLQYVTFFPAVTIAAILGGYRACLAATLLGIVFATCIFTPPYYEFSLQVLHKSLWSNLVFLVDGLVISLSVETLHGYRKRFKDLLERTESERDGLALVARRLRQIGDNMFCYTALLDKDGLVLEMNQAPLVRSGLDRNSVIGQRFVDGPWWTHDPQVQTRLVAAMNKARQGEIQRYEETVRMGTELVVIDLQISPLFDDHHAFIGFVPMAVDITDRKRGEQKLMEATERLSLATQAGGVGVWDWNLQDNQLTWDAQMFALYGIPVNHAANAIDVWRESLHPDDAQKVGRLFELARDDTQRVDTEYRIVWPDGAVHSIRALACVQRGADGSALRMIGTNWDITKEKQTQAELSIAAATFNTHDAIMIVDANERILRVNQSFEDITGYSAADVLGHTPRILSSGTHDLKYFQTMWRRILDDGYWEGEIVDRRKSGETYPKWLNISAIKNSEGSIVYFVAIFNDISDRKQNEDRIHTLAFYDSLTKLPNRRLLQDRLQQVVASQERRGNHSGLLFIDLDNFKTLNDTRGHEVGDQLLQEAAKRIAQSVRDTDTVARLGGDEFVVMLTDLHPMADIAATQAEQISVKIGSTLSEVYHFTGFDHRCSASIGVTLFHEGSVGADDVMKQADIALYQAKAAGKNVIRFFDPHMQESINAHANVERELQDAIGNDELQLHYQIQVDRDLRPIGAEALIRWMHREKGMVSPAVFIPIAETSSLIVAIGQWVLETACKQLHRWSLDEHSRNLTLAVNVSAHQFRLPNFVDNVAQALRAFQVDPARLKLELTESAIVTDVPDVIQKMHALRGLGVRISLDDFGTGYSSLSYLKRLPLNQLKVDQSFVRDIASDPGDAIMVKTIIEMAKNFSLSVIAEGVETRAQYEFLRQSGCMAYQGYLFGKPMAIDAFDAWMQSKRESPVEHSLGASSMQSF